jgi:hypothetical protein
MGKNHRFASLLANLLLIGAGAALADDGQRPHQQQPQQRPQSQAEPQRGQSAQPPSGARQESGQLDRDRDRLNQLDRDRDRLHLLEQRAGRLAGGFGSGPQLGDRDRSMQRLSESLRATTREMVQSMDHLRQSLQDPALAQDPTARRDMERLHERLGKMGDQMEESLRIMERLQQRLHRPTDPT